MTDPDYRWRPTRPYNQSPALPPVGESESRAVRKASIEARAALAELKQAAENLCSAVCVGLLIAVVLSAGSGVFEFKARRAGIGSYEAAAPHTATALSADKSLLL